MPPTINQHINGPGTLGLHTHSGKEYFLPGQIIRLEAKSNYTKIYFTNHPPLVMAKVLKDFELSLLPYGFLRIHRSHLVNKIFIQAINSAGQIIIGDAYVAAISRRRKGQIIKALRA